MAKLGRANKRIAKSKGKAKKQFTKANKTLVSTINKVISKNDETKYFTYGTSLQPPISGSITTYNLFYHNVSQGTTNNTMIGDKINWRGIKLKYTVLSQNGSGTWIDNPFQIVMAVVATKTYNAISSLTLADIRDDTNTSTSRFFLNNQSKILFKKTVSVQFNKTGDRKRVDGSFWLKRNQMIKFKDFTASHELSGMNYYLAFWAHDENNTLSSTGTVFFSYKNYYKDA